MANEKEASDELLAEAAAYANKVLGVAATEHDTHFAHEALSIEFEAFDVDDPDDMGGAWALLIIGYVEVARRGGRA